MNKIKVTELFTSLQGEGRYVGVPSVFLRTFGCNFSCAGFGCAPGEKSIEADIIAKDVHLYANINDLPLAKTGCDSYISWHPAFKNFSPFYTTGELAKKIQDILPNGKWQQKSGNSVHLVITGGEPLLGWQRAYLELFKTPELEGLEYITFETNGTQHLSTNLKEYISNDHRLYTFSVSPKLSSSGERRVDAIKPSVIEEYNGYGMTYLKFVVETEQHIDEVDEVVELYREAGFDGNVYLMAVGGTEQSYFANATKVADMALARGYYYSPRLHVDLWKNGWAR